MNNRQFVCSVEVWLMAALMLGGPAYAQTNGPGDTRVGCIHLDASGAHFIDVTNRTRTQAIADMQAAQASGGNAGDPCLSGRVADVPARVYAGLAKKYPAHFAPLPGATASRPAVVPSAASSTAAPFNATYAFTNLDALVPPAFLPFFSVTGLASNGRVYGALYDNNFNEWVAVYANGSITPLVAGVISTVSHNGIVGGSIVTDPVNYYTQAAIFRGNSVELVPRLAGEITSNVTTINDSGTAIVVSYDANFNGTVYGYRNGKALPVNVSIPGLYPSIMGMNNAGVLVGYVTIQEGPTSYSWLAFSYDLDKGTTTTLPPLPSNPFSWATGINGQGDIVGYSWGPTADERIGIWPASGGGFVEYFHEGTPQYPTVSNELLINDEDVIVITRTTDLNSYLVPSQGVRLSLTHLINYDPSTDGLPSYVFGLNNAGAITGLTTGPGYMDFLLLPQPGKQ
ncbi:hypothetical protein [Paraburkholderia guartelaensis]|uniref:DUF3466 family protein n=1 Tax=Paraburkholderia guartelaensis TaxID=2546446 RepID=A0ABU9SMW5_9BURK